MIIGIYGTEFRENFTPYMQQLLDKLQKEGVGISIYAPFARYLKEIVTLPASFDTFERNEDVDPLDMLLSIGGDGTFLKTIGIIQDSGTPVLGINAGRLGFLSYVSEEKIAESMDLILAGDYGVKERHLISATTNDNLFGEFNYALLLDDHHQCGNQWGLP